MKAYLITTGLIFALITAMHIWRFTAERPSDMKYISGMAALTVLTTGLSIWAWRLLRTGPRQS